VIAEPLQQYLDCERILSQSSSSLSNQGEARMELKSGKDILVTGVLILSALTSGLLRAQTANFPLTASDPEPQRLVLDASLVQPAPPAQASQPELPNAPSSMLASSGPSSSLEDLGFAPQQTQAHEQLQAMLEKRAHMLKIHQRLGLITAIPLRRRRRQTWIFMRRWAEQLRRFTSRRPTMRSLRPGCQGPADMALFACMKRWLSSMRRG
jgi:hypothetical protein